MWMYVFFLAVLVFSGLWLFVWPGWRKKRLLAKPFPAAWLGTLKTKITFYEKLQPAEQQQLLDLIRLFIADKQYFGCDGLQITDEIRVTIAAEACLLLLNRETQVYPDLRYILVYPYAFRVTREEHNPDGTVSANGHGLLGESWHNGKVILSWDDVEKGVSDRQDGHNVVLHEFSHQLDSQNGSANGLPPLRGSHSIKTWATVFSAEFAALNEAVEGNHSTVMDYYGATNAAEFFAVATETFFEKPVQLERLHPLLYAELSKYYRVDPKQWV
jgi:Mlc titration factor MtfA (ptsG expression regulator)